MKTSIERVEDMSHDGKLILHIQDDGDIIVRIQGYDYASEPTSAHVEFCEVDNKERPINI